MVERKRADFVILRQICDRVVARMAALVRDLTQLVMLGKDTKHRRHSKPLVSQLLLEQESPCSESSNLTFDSDATLSQYAQQNKKAGTCQQTQWQHPPVLSAAPERASCLQRSGLLKMHFVTAIV